MTLVADYSESARVSVMREEVMRVTRTVALGFADFKTGWPVLCIGATDESEDGPKPSSASLRKPPPIYGVGVMGEPR